ncbi:MAG: hypothetical protein K2X03_03955 [Bryobacteraceae bacterium]|nr:hypothetical protein [Bryobacteraceae bacterium]
MMKWLSLACPILLSAQSLDTGYSAQIKQFTTDPQFLTELVDHLPASATVPTPEKFLGHIAGAPDHLTYAADVHKYFRAVAQASPRVRVLSLGKSEEGRETILALISDEANLKRLDRLKEITAKLADPRKLTEAESKTLIAEGLPFYWATGSLHSPETGSPEMLMELVYRLAVEDTALVRNIRQNTVIMMTPVTEVDGRERMVDLYRWRKANPNRTAPPLLYWGKYVAHDNNRDGMALSLNLSQMVMKTFFDYHPQVMHDLHESVPYLYISTGMGPYNAWIDPIVVNEWQKLAYNEIEELTKRGVAGVWTHGFYDGWAANYMFMAAQGHNSIGRFYETFGNGGADTRDRTLPASSTSRTWFRPNPPFEKVRWSMRNNTNLQQSGLLLGMNYVANNKATFLENFYLKSLRSVQKAAKEGPAAYVIPGNDPRPGQVAGLVNLLRAQGVEVHRLTETSGSHVEGSYVVRMDQPYSRQADMLLDTQYYSANDPRPYDDTGWTLGALRNIQTTRVTDAAILKASMTLVNEAPKPTYKMIGDSASAGFLIAHNADVELMQFRVRLQDVKMQAVEEGFSFAGREFAPGAFLIRTAGNPPDLRAQVEREARALGLTVYALAELPRVATHELAMPRVALVHTWLNTQSEGWYRMEFDKLGIPYDYVSDHALRNPNLRAKWDVIILGPVPATAQRLVNGVPMRGGDPIPWKASALTPNFGTGPDQVDDIRGGMGLAGVQNIAQFVEAGGLFVTVAGNASLPIDYGLIDGVTIQTTQALNVRGSVVRSQVADELSPIAYGYSRTLPVYFNQAPVLNVRTTGLPGETAEAPAARTSGRGSLTDPDIPQGRPYSSPLPRAMPPAPGEEAPASAEMLEQMRAYVLPEGQRPRVVLRFADEANLLVSGMLTGGRELALKPAVVDVPRGQGHFLLFANNPMWRHQTQGSFFLLFNALLNFNNLDAGRAKGARRAANGVNANDLGGVNP